jgi:excisionase family DNA binding protein
MKLRDIDTLTMTVEEAGKLLGIGRSSAYGAIRRGELPFLKIGRRILVPRSALFRKIEDLQQDPNLLRGADRE